MASQVTDFSYMGKQITITEDHPMAVINIDGASSAAITHDADSAMMMSMCDGAMTW